MEKLLLVGVGRRLDDVVETLEALEHDLEPNMAPEFGHADVEFVGIYYHHLWQVTLGLFAFERITGEQRAAFRSIFGEDVDVSEMRRLRQSGEYDLAIAAFTDFIRWIIIFEGSVSALDSRASRIQGVSLELVAVFEAVIAELFLVEPDNISWRTYRYVRALVELRGVLDSRWGTSRPFRSGELTPRGA